jgi:Tol biopolymer transport system component
MRFLVAVFAVTALAAGVTSSAAQPRNSRARLAFARSVGILETDIWTADGAGGNRHRVARLRGLATDEPSWAPAGRRLAFTVDHRPPGGRANIYVTRAGGSGVHPLTPLGGTDETSPAWSPGGRKIAFVKWQRGPSGSRASLGVFVMRPDGSGQRPLTRNTCDDSLAWAPHGQRVVVSRCGSLYVLNADGTNPRRLTTPPPPDPVTGGTFSDDAPAWSPNGRFVAFVRVEQFDDPESTDTAEIYVIGAAGSGERRLTHGGYANSPTWSPYSTLVAFADYGNYARIRAVSPTTGRTRTLVAIPGADVTSPAWRR